MGLAMALVGMTSLAMAMLLVPLLLRQRAAVSHEAYNLTVYRDQLAEVERDIERGVLSAEEATAARAEISRRMLALSRNAAAARPNSATPVVVAVITVAVLPFAALSLYWHLGSPSAPDEPFADRGAVSGTAVAGKAPHVDMAKAIAELSARLKAHPDDIEGWLLLGRSDLSLGRYQEGADAYHHAVELSGQRPDILGDYGEALTMAAGGTVTPAAKKAFEVALKNPDTAPRSRYYLGLAQLQAGDTKAALRAWVDLAGDSPKDAAWLPMLRQRIDAAAASIGVDPASLKTSSGASLAAVLPAKPPPSPPAAGAAPATGESGMPSAATVAEVAKATAGAPPDARQAMILAMVQRLADRLHQHPDDGDGWVRLGRSYMVLHKPQEAREAYAQAIKLKPDSLELKLAYANAIIDSTGGDAKAPPAALTNVMRQVLQADPNNHQALWYVGIAEAEAGHKKAAHRLWQKLLAELPAGTPERKAVEQRLAALNLDAAK